MADPKDPKAQGTQDNAPNPEDAGSGGATPAAESDVIWVISNRLDDRVVLFERDPRHPGGEAFVGGSAPDKVARTAEVERLLHTGEIVKIPEPPDGPKKPVDYDAAVPQAPPAQPGQPIRLGRKMDPDLVPARAQKGVQQQQQQAPRQIASRATVPPPPRPETETHSS